MSQCIWQIAFLQLASSFATTCTMVSLKYCHGKNLCRSRQLSLKNSRHEFLRLHSISIPIIFAPGGFLAIWFVRINSDILQFLWNFSEIPSLGYSLWISVSRIHFLKHSLPSESEMSSGSFFSAKWFLVSLVLLIGSFAFFPSDWIRCALFKRINSNRFQ